jgi:hypothetical protein
MDYMALWYVFDEYRHLEGSAMKAYFAAAVLISACGQPVPDIDIDGVGVKDETGVLLADPTFPDRFRRQADSALRYAGGSWNDLRGYVVVFMDSGTVQCNEVAVGCENSFSNTIHVAFKGLQQPRCFANTALVHEILHVVIGDRCHDDPRFQDFMDPQDEIWEFERGFDACKVVDRVFWTTEPSC